MERTVARDAHQLEQSSDTALSLTRAHQGNYHIVDGRRYAGLPPSRSDPAVDRVDFARSAGVEVLPGRFLDFRDPWGNRIEIVGYDNIQFSKAPNVLRGMGLGHLGKTDSALSELAEKGMAPE